jgi:hypothetical protein
MTTILIPICYKCKNRENLVSDPPVCKAFPKGIPDKIIFNGEQHNTPLPTQDNDIVFEPVEDLLEQYQ